MCEDNYKHSGQICQKYVNNCLPLSYAAKPPPCSRGSSKEHSNGADNCCRRWAENGKPCWEEQGDCDNDDHCVEGLICGNGTCENSGKFYDDAETGTFINYSP